jgi:hypothetical protein
MAMLRNVIALLFLGAAVACAQSITIQNSGFEAATLPLVNPNVATFSNLVSGSPIATGGSLANWTATASSANAAAGAIRANGSSNNYGYLYAFGVGVNVSLSQVLSTSLQNNTSYTLSALISAVPTYQFSYSIELWAGSTELASSTKLEETPNFVSGTDSFTYYSGSNNPQAGQPLTIFLRTIGAVQGNTGAFFDNISLTASSGLVATNVLPQLAFGGGWYTALYFTNTTNTPVSFPVNLIDGNGNPLSAAAIGGASTMVNLPARGTSSIQFPNAGPLVQGYVSLTLPSGVTGYGVFRQSVPGTPDQEAVVPLSGVTHTTSTLLFDDTNNIVTGVAVVNLGSATAVNATAYDSNGNVLGTSTIPLAPHGKTAAALQSLIPATAGVLGSVDFTVTTGNVAALGLRFNGAAFTSIPTSDR